MLNGVLESLFLLFGFGNVVNVFASIFVLFLSLALTVLIFLSGVVLLLILHLLFSFALLSLAIVEVIIVPMLDFLHVRCNLGTVLGLFSLHSRVQVRYFGFLLSDLSTGVVVEIVNHIFLDLKHVPLDLSVL